ncbi:MAG: TusE/DsrC/DsvC family sulfur relay protein [Acidiferrobacterales bacterium]|nr:TusE/DsrC/DsvC family sulfur relay protein [Acidiferrobacterales bacterium]
MPIEVDGKILETTETGFLVNRNEWNERVAAVLAEQEGVTLSDRHWEVINYLRDCYFNHGGELPNNRQILKGMQEVWSGQGIDSKMLYELFPGGPSKQAGRIAGLPESMRKGGY